MCFQVDLRKRLRTIEAKIPQNTDKKFRASKTPIEFSLNLIVNSAK